MADQEAPREFSAEETKAALQINRVAHSFRMRREFARKFAQKIRVMIMVKRLRFAKKLQPICNGYRVRKNFVRDLMLAATAPIRLMQRFGRGYRERKHLNEERLAIIREKTKIALRTQVFLRMLKSRKRAKLKQMKISILTMQRVGRAMFGRMSMVALIRKRYLKRLKMALRLQAAGRAFRERVDCGRQRVIEYKNKVALFHWTTKRFFIGWRVRRVLGRANAKWRRERRQFLHNLVARIGHGYFDRRFTAQLFLREQRRKALVLVARLLQKVGRGMAERKEVFKLHAREVLDAQRRKMRRMMMRACFSLLQRCGRGYMKRKRCFRKWFRVTMAQKRIGAAALGCIARMHLGRVFHGATVLRRARKYESIEGDDWQAVQEIARQNEELVEELGELNSRFDDLLNPDRVHPVAKKLLLRPMEKYEREVIELRRRNERLKRQAQRCGPEAQSYLIAKVEAASREYIRTAEENGKLESRFSSQSERLAQYKDELDSFEDLVQNGKAQIAAIEKQREHQMRTQQRLETETEKIEEACGNIELKASFMGEFIERSPSVRQTQAALDFARISSSSQQRKDLTYHFEEDDLQHSSSPNKFGAEQSYDFTMVQSQLLSSPSGTMAMSQSNKNASSPGANVSTRRSQVGFVASPDAGPSPTQASSPSRSTVLARSKSGNNRSSALNRTSTEGSMRRDNVGICVGIPTSSKLASLSKRNLASLQHAGSPVRSVRILNSGSRASLTALDQQGSPTHDQQAQQQDTPFIVVKTPKDLNFLRLQIEDCDTLIAALTAEIDAYSKEIDSVKGGSNSYPTASAANSEVQQTFLTHKEDDLANGGQGIKRPSAQTPPPLTQEMLRRQASDEGNDRSHAQTPTSGRGGAPSSQQYRRSSGAVASSIASSSTLPRASERSSRNPAREEKSWSSSSSDY